MLLKKTRIGGKGSTRDDTSSQLAHDLLCEDPELRIEAESLRADLPFAFVSGDSNGSIDSALGNLKLGDSAFNPTAFQDEAFLEELIAMCIQANMMASRRRSAERC